jgi:ribonuclease HI
MEPPRLTRETVGGEDVFLSPHHTTFTSRRGLGDGTNNYSELMALKLLLLFSLEKGCRSLQVFGDSLVIINWANGIHR